MRSETAQSKELKEGAGRPTRNDYATVEKNAKCRMRSKKATRLLICYPVFCKYKRTYSLVNAIDMFFKTDDTFDVVGKKRYR